ncbi:MAG: hypothetical protein ACRBBK_08305 [Paracoccaceae bacterium]
MSETPAIMRRIDGRGLAAWSIAASLAAFALMQIFAAIWAGGVFEYPLDDPYIHLAMAEQIWQGGYGVNPGELASAASSPLYPVLLAPFAGSDLGRFAPLLLNVFGIVGAAYLFARLLIESGFIDRYQRVGRVMAIGAPIALNLPGLGFTGMEHSLHAAFSLAIVLGLVRLVQGRGIGIWLVLGVFFAPMMRLEGVALGLLASGAAFAYGARGGAFGLMALSLAPLAAFVGFLSALGIGPLPSSVMAKMLDGGMADAGFVEGKLAEFSNNISSLPGIGLLVLTGLALIGAMATRDKGARTLLIVGSFTGLAHLFFGQVGWLNRYEIYAVLVIAALIFASLGLLGAPRLGGVALASVLTILVMGFAYGRDFLAVGIWAPQGIHLQQAQMARFVRDYAPVDIAVNDLGRVAWRNPGHVLDLWGLASADARKARILNPKEGWAGNLVARDGAPLVMIYAHPFAGAMGADWIALGKLQLRYARGFLGGPEVEFYASGPQAAPELRAALAVFAQDLPDGVRFVAAGQGGAQ